MKTKALIVAGCLSMIIGYTVPTFACGNNNCGSGSCDPNETACQCTDPNCGKNPCLSCSDCCAAFGNVGAR